MARLIGAVVRARAARRTSLAVVVATAAGLLGAGTADAAPICETLWLLPVDGSWSDVTKWSNGVPNASDPLRDLACITVDGTYTVTLQGTASAAGLTLGGASGTQTLRIVGSAAQGNATLDLGTAAGSEGIGSHGVVELTDSDGGAKTAALTITSGTLANGGVIKAERPAANISAGTRFLNGNVTNTGTIDVDATALRQTTAAATWTNKGKIVVQTTGAGSKLFFDAGTNYVQESGVFWAFAPFRQEGGSFTQTGGDLEGGFELANVTISPSGGTGTDGLILTGTCILGSDVAAGHQLKVVAGFGPNPGDAKLRVLASRTNAGVISLESTNGPHASTLAIENGTLTNAAQVFSVGQAGSSRSIDGNFVNDGLLSMGGGPTVQHTSGASWTNNGVFSIGLGATLDLGPAVFTNQTGSTLTGGTYQIYDSSVFKYAGANVVTNSAFLDVSNSSLQNSSGTDALLGLATVTSSGHLRLAGRSLTTAGPVSNAGFVLVDSGATLTTTGDYTQTAGTTTVFNQLVASGGSVKIQGGELRGNGTVASPVANTGGTVKPTATSIGQPMTLHVSGPYTQGAGGTLAIEIVQSWPNWGKVESTGPASLNGTLALNVTPIAGSGPVTVLTSSQRLGTFATTTATGGGPSHVAYDQTSVYIGNPPTAARVLSFSVRRAGTAAVVRWRTGTDTGLLGFKIYREVRGARVAVSGLIPAGGSPTGRPYSWRGRATGTRARYRLAGIRPDGSRTWLAAAVLPARGR